MRNLNNFHRQFRSPIHPIRAFGLVVLLALTSVTPLVAQQTVVSTPFQRFGDSFYENFGLQWAFNGRGRNGGFFANGPGLAPPPFGRPDPNADARFGFNRGGRNGNFSMNFVAGQGSNRFNSVVVPSVVVPNGGTGFISDTTLRPFVTGVVPVVGFQPPRVISPIKQRLEMMKQRAAQSENPQAALAEQIKPVERAPAPRVRHVRDSTANHGDLSVAEIRRRKAAQAQSIDSELALLVAKARGKEELGQVGVAIIYYQQAASRATGEQKYELNRKVQSLKEARTAKR